MLRGKRGSCSKLALYRKASMRDEVLFLLASLMIVTFLAFMVFTYINNKAGDLGFEKRFIAIDLGMAATSLYATPGNVVYQYQPPLKLRDSENITLSLAMGGIGEEDTRVFVVQQDRGEFNPPWYYYARDKSIPRFHLPFTEYGPDIDLTFYRFGYDLTTDISQTNYNKITCPPIARDNEESEIVSKNPAWTRDKNIYFDITKTDPSDTPSQREQEVGEQLKTVLKNKNRFVIVDDPKEADVEIAIRIRRQTELGAIRTYVDEESENLKEARSLGCSLLNELLTPQTYVKYVQVVPISKVINESWTDMLMKDPERKNVRVVLELGILDKSQMDFENSANAIFNALARFYGTSVRLRTSGATISVDFFVATAQALSQQAGAAGSLTQTQSVCQGKDEATIDFPFNDAEWLNSGESNGGRVWIPKQANCPGTYPVIIWLHGIKKDAPRFIHGSMNKGGPNEGGDDITLEAKAVIDAGESRPFLIAAPSQDNAGAARSSTLWSDFDTTAFLRELKKALPESINIGQLILLGHSGAGCNPSGGIYGAIQTGDYYLVVESDSCMNANFGTPLKNVLDRQTRYVNWFIPTMWKGSRESSSSAFENGWDEQNSVMGITKDIACPEFTDGGVILDNCKSDEGNWLSIPVRGIESAGHKTMKKLAVRFIAKEYLYPISGSTTSSVTPSLDESADSSVDPNLGQTDIAIGDVDVAADTNSSSGSSSELSEDKNATVEGDAVE